ncbi:F-box protein At3g07870-like [Actinidia eriantha]|uniref:F-box protein At3g07870-like n=1 Tax=Actinidia eriantha TaxID=165200 RepID=UPI0025861B8B|nr:F-box protein At3g07870-like [Actinidia eriantha]
MAIQHLPEDVSVEILSRLPVKSLLQFRLVFKYWLSLIQSPRFIAFHQNHAKNTECLLVNQFLNGGHGDCVLSLVSDETRIENWHESFTGLNIEYPDVFASSNGLVCLANLRNPKIMICSPAMKEFRILPEPFYHTNNIGYLGFGFDSKTNDYKVIRVSVISEYEDSSSHENDSTDSEVSKSQFKSDHEKLQIYNLSTDDWREIDGVVPVGFVCQPYPEFHTSLSGDFYWFAYDLNPYHDRDQATIIVFRMSDKLFKQIPVPEDCSWPVTKLCALNNSLALILCPITKESGFDIWVIDECSVKGSWTKKYIIIGPVLGGPFYALGFRQNGEFLLVGYKYRQMVSYSLNTQIKKEYDVYDCQSRSK